MGDDTDWTWVDAWILASTPDSLEGHDLSELIENADIINHALPTRDELSRSLGSLIAAGLVEVTAGRFMTTATGTALRSHWTGGMFGWSASLLPLLAALPRPVSDLPMSDLEVAAAEQAYISRT